MEAWITELGDPATVGAVLSLWFLMGLSLFMAFLFGIVGLRFWPATIGSAFCLVNAILIRFLIHQENKS